MGLQTLSLSIILVVQILFEASDMSRTQIGKLDACLSVLLDDVASNIWLDPLSLDNHAIVTALVDIILPSFNTFLSQGRSSSYV